MAKVAYWCKVNNHLARGVQQNRPRQSASGLNLHLFQARNTVETFRPETSGLFDRHIPRDIK
jgi:hypothetical protein